MPKIQNPIITHQDRWANPKHIFKPLLTENYSMEGRPFILEQFENQLLESEIAFYPSSGSDISDLVYFRTKQHPILSDVKPTIFIHSDYMCNAYYAQELDNRLIQHSFSIDAKFCYLSNNDQKFIKIYKLKFKDEKQVFWLAFLGGYYNEEIIEFLIKHNLKTKTVYTYCDGITHGSGMETTELIPTIFYPFIAEKLGIEHIITEQDANWITELVYKRDDFDFHAWLKKTNELVPNETTRLLLEIKDTTELKNKIVEALTKYEEHPIDEIEHPKLVIKKIS
jgi:hypothetical protein